MSTSTGTTLLAAPVQPTQRIGIIDALRGFAILGILLMNIQGFAIPGIIAFDPTIMHESGTINSKLWFAMEWIPEGTQRALFSMLFGAGIILFTSRLEKKLDGVRPAEYFIRRQLWLMLFGLINIYVLLWWGDILFDYACAGLLMFIFRNCPPKKLMIGAVVCMMLMVARENRQLYLDKKMLRRGEQVSAIDTTKVQLTLQQKEWQAEYDGFRESATPQAKKKRIEKEIRQMTGNYETTYNRVSGDYLNYMLVQHGYLSIWDILTFMFLGMFLFRTGVLTGEGNMKVYWALAIIGLGGGLWLSWYRIQFNMSRSFDYYRMLKDHQFDFYTISRVLRSLGIFGVLMLLFRSGRFRWLFALMRPVGQMAFTNYLTQSLICAIIFYGVGFGYFGHLPRYQVYLVVAAIWVLQITWSHLWLRYFFFGPLEWCWRSLTYGKFQPIRKRPVVLMAME